MSCINTILETMQFLVLFIYYYFEAFVMIFFPTHKNVAGEIVLITGAANGIGREIAIHFAPLGVKLVLWDIDEEGNKETIRLAKINGAKEVYAYRCDCSNRKEVYKTADLVRREVCDVTILVNDAGILNGKYFIDTPDPDIERTMDVNIMAHFWTCKAFLPAMIARNHGHLVSISSAAGLAGINKMSDYAASKFAIVGFLETVAFELQATGKKGVKTTIVFLSYAKTQLSAGIKVIRPCLLPMMDPRYIGRKIVEATRKEKFYLFLPSYLSLFSLKNFIPKKVLFLIFEYLGIFNIMDNYIGWRKKDAN